MSRSLKNYFLFLIKKFGSTFYRPNDFFTSKKDVEE